MPPVPADVVKRIVDQSLKQLELKRGASWDEVKKAHRLLSAKHHPDRVRTDAAKAKAEERFKLVQTAFQALELHYKKEVAA